MTQQQIEEYSKEIEDFFHKFMAEGPGSVGENLDKGKWINMCIVMPFFTKLVFRKFFKG